MMAFEPRTYRENMNRERFRNFTIVNKETDLWIGVSPSSWHPSMPSFCNERVLFYREQLETCIKQNPLFLKSYNPIELNDYFPEIAKSMAHAAAAAGTGPMASVAGAFAQYLGHDMIGMYDPTELVIENGGDIFVSIEEDILVRFFTGENEHFSNLALRVPGFYRTVGICTSSGMFGHSFSFGKADSVTVVCNSATLADAWATAICNHVKTSMDIQSLLERSKNIPEIISLIIIKDYEIGVSGKFVLEKLS